MHTGTTTRPFRQRLEQLASHARQLGIERLSLVSQDEQQRALCGALVRAGASVRRLVIRYDDEQPYVLETVELCLCGLVVEATSPPRPASPGEMRALESDGAFLHLGTYVAVEMTNGG